MIKHWDFRASREAALKRGEERNAERKLGLEIIRIGYKELTKFGVSAERAAHLKAITKRLRQCA